VKIHPDHQLRQVGPFPPAKPISRRSFLQALSAFAAGLLAAACSPAGPPETPPPAPTVGPTFTPADTPTATSTVAPPPTATATATPAASAQPPIGTLTPTATPTATSTPALSPTAPALARVAIARAAGYDRAGVRRQVQALLDGLGGLEDVVGRGDRVAIKVNLTGGTGSEPPASTPAVERFVTHPEVVRAVGELLRDAGAGQLFIVESVWDPRSYPLWGYEEVAQGLGATLVDLNAPQPYKDFVSVPVGADWFVYPEYIVNPILQDVDVFVSVAKMKCHWCCGVTLSMKNLVGLTPMGRYQCKPGDVNRTDLHGCDGVFKARLPRVVVDLNRVRPIQLALIDGIKTVEAGEGPWIETMAPVAPGVLVAGKNAVATDAIASAVMGFDPTAAYLTPPFLHSDNHLSLAHDRALGPHCLEEIEVVGAAIQDVRYNFTPCWV
jgi:uncharacterized protein (DUF362 family)